MTSHQDLPRAGADREALREKGQFWTPEWVAEAMVAYALSEGSNHIFDPAVGAGAFFRAAKTVGKRIGRQVDLLGTEVFPEALREARTRGLSDADLAKVQIADFVRNPPDGDFAAIAANPPYIRHHRLPADLKAFLKALSMRLIGRPLDGRAGLHVFFLIRALERLRPGGKLAFILPADTAEGVFASTLWDWVARKYRLDTVVTFDRQATPFPGVDTNALVFLIANAPPEQSFIWAQCHERGGALTTWVSGGLERSMPGVTMTRRELVEALRTGLSRPPSTAAADGPVLGDFCRVLRGIATGANEFFFLTRSRVDEIAVPPEFLVPAIGRTRDVVGCEVSPLRLSELEEAGRPTWLLSPDGRPMDDFPPRVRDYLAQGEALGLPARPLIASRRPWYRMEKRTPPPFLFAYLGRRNARFVRNNASVVPLTGFLCVYPRIGGQRSEARLWEVLTHPATVANLPLVGKSYGGGAIKVEPRALESLPLPLRVVTQAGLEAPVSSQQLLSICGRVSRKWARAL